LHTGGKFACFAIAQVHLLLPLSSPSLHVVNNQQFFFNFGPNATTFIIPAEVYPSRVRGFAHGFPAAVGKFDASLAALLFNHLSGSTVIGLANVLWIFFCLQCAGGDHYLVLDP
jgi:PHS family inorganic phosphate transporter-like MFS transporter